MFEEFNTQIHRVMEIGEGQNNALLPAKQIGLFKQELYKFEVEFLKDAQLKFPNSCPPALTKLQNWFFRILTQSPNPQLVAIVRDVCVRNYMFKGTEEIPRSKFFCTEQIPSPSQIIKLIRSNSKDIQIMKPIPQDFELILQEVSDCKGFVPNLQTLLMHFPTYLKNYIELTNYLFENEENPLSQVQAYFFAIMGASTYGSMYLFRRLSKRFLEVGGDRDWLLGNLPQKIEKFKTINSKLAYCPWALTKQDIVPLLKFYQIKPITFAITILSLYQSLACLCLANGIISESCIGPCEQIIQLKELKQYPLWEQCQKYHVASNAFKGQCCSLAQLAEQLQKKASTYSPSSQTQVLRHSDSDFNIEYMKIIDKQMKSLNRYQKISKAFSSFLDTSIKVQRFDHSKYPTLECATFGFKPGVFIYLQDVDKKLAQNVQRFVEYTKDMTNNLIGPKKQCSTYNIRQAIRFYYENLCGYSHQHYNYKQKITNYISKQLKFLIKVVNIYPFLMEESVIKNIPHQDWVMSFFDTVHISLLSINTKFQLTMTLACRTLKTLTV